MFHDGSFLGIALISEWSRYHRLVANSNQPEGKRLRPRQLQPARQRELRWSVVFVHALARIKGKETKGSQTRTTPRDQGSLARPGGMCGRLVHNCLNEALAK
jgi:hypothetical protein